MFALHRYIAATQAKFVAVMLTDAVGDRRIQNQPGTHREYPNWRLPLCDSAGSPVLLEDLVGMEQLRRLAAIMADRPPAGLFSAKPKRPAPSFECHT